MARPLALGHVHLSAPNLSGVRQPIHPAVPWARAFYHQQRQRGKTHHAAVRSLAFKWIRILWRCWQDHAPYDDARYERALTQHGAPLATQLHPVLAQA